MSRKKPKKVFCLMSVSGEHVFALARHAKGARSVAAEHGHEISPKKSDVYEVHEGMAYRAINKENRNG